jgi:hypothetical protein
METFLSPFLWILIKDDDPLFSPPSPEGELMETSSHEFFPCLINWGGWRRSNMNLMVWGAIAMELLGKFWNELLIFERSDRLVNKWGSPVMKFSGNFGSI